MTNLITPNTTNTEQAILDEQVGDLWQEQLQGALMTLPGELREACVQQFQIILKNATPDANTPIQALAALAIAVAGDLLGNVHASVELLAPATPGAQAARQRASLNVMANVIRSRVMLVKKLRAEKRGGKVDGSA